MTIDQTANFVRGTVSSSVGGSDTTISVDDASIYPDPSNGNYNLVLWDADSYIRPDADPNVEIVRVSGRDTTNNTLTVSRGQEGTSSLSHPATSALQLAPTAKVFDSIDTKISSQVSITGSNGLNGGSAELGGSIDISISGDLSLDSGLVATDGEVIWDEASTHIPQGRLENSSLTVAGNSVSLGGSTSINHGDLSTISSDDHHTKYTDENAQDAVGSILSADFTYDDAGNSISLSSNSVTVAGNAVSLGDSTAINHSDLSNVGASDHHTKYTDSDAIGAINNDVDHGSTASHNYFSGSHNDLSNVGASDHHTKYTDSDSITAINNDTDHGSTASHNYFSGSHNDLSNVGASDHHTKYSDADARGAIEAGAVSEVAFANIESLNSDRSIGIDDSEGPMYRDHSGNHYSLWNSNYVSGGTDISISGGVGASGGDVTISHGDTSTQGNVTTGGATVIDDIYIDGRGHVTNMNTQNRGLDDWATPTSTVQFDRNGIQSVDSWIEIDGNGSGILMNYKNQGDETRFYGPTNVRNTLTIQGSNGGRIVLPVGTDMFA